MSAAASPPPAAAPQMSQAQKDFLAKLTPEVKAQLAKLSKEQQQMALQQLFAKHQAAAAAAAKPATAASGTAAAAATATMPTATAAPATGPTSTGGQIAAQAAAANAAAIAAANAAAAANANQNHAPSLTPATPQQMAQAAAWKPTPDGLEKMCVLFRENATSNEQHQKNYQQLIALSAHPHFNNYLAYILSSCKNEPDIVRQRAGLKLKNNIKESFETMHPVAREYIKQHVLATIGDTVLFVRNTVGTIIANIVSKDRFENWPVLLPTVMKLLDHPTNANAVAGAWDAIYKICEDVPRYLDSEKLGRPLEHLIPKFISCFGAKNEQLRAYAINSCNQFLPMMPAALVKHLDKYMQGLFALAADPSKEIRKSVCYAFCALQEVRYDVLKPQMANVIKYMIKATEDDSEVVALEACEFWSSYCENKQADLPLLREHLPKLLPILLKCMRYSDTDSIIMGGGDEDDADKADSQADMKPRFHQSKISSYGEDEDWDDDDDSGSSEWNLRKCAAASLDTIATVFQHEILPILLPLLQATLSNRDTWEIRESGILALGAVADGCFRGIQQYLKDLVPYLIELLKDTKPLVRSITCWTLSRYSKWVMAEPNDDLYFKPLMIELLRRVLDRNKRVQEAACSAFATLEEEANDRLIKYLGPILQNLMFAFSTYQAKNMLILYDAIGTLAEAVGNQLAKPEHMQVLLPPLLNRLAKLPDDDRNLFPLLECLTSVVQALESKFTQFARPVYARCLQIIERNIIAQQHATAAAAHGVDADQPDKEFVVCALDLLSSIAEALETSVEALVGPSNILPLLLHCIRDQDPDVRQSAFALLGDLAKTCIVHLRPHLERFLPVAAMNLNPKIVAVCNNASWAIGEIAVKTGADMKPFVPNLMQYLIAILVSEGMIPNLLENTAITIGRLGVHCPEGVAKDLQRFASHWCAQLARIRAPVEKDIAFRSLSAVIQKNPQGMLPHFGALCMAIASWQPQPPPELKKHFATILSSFKTSLGTQWVAFFGKCSQPLQKHLSELYGV